MREKYRFISDAGHDAANEACAFCRQVKERQS